MAPDDARRLGIKARGLVRVETEIHFVVKVQVTEGIGPGVVACSLPAGIAPGVHR
jgi:anaerobic selenocysteine-containing dehydrogenase